jgi:disulfide bond formation protein DsbB
MSIDAVTTFLALLAVLALVVVVVSLVGWLVARIRGGLPPALAPLRDAVGEVALWGAFAVALTATLGSLYLSEVAHFPPCELCWYQRIAMYPLSVVLGVAALRRDAGVRWYAIPVAVIGAGISTYHYLLERFPDSVASSCDVEVPCTVVWVWKFHFLSIPGMAWIGFAAIITLVLLARPPAGPATQGATSGQEADRPTTEDVLT